MHWLLHVLGADNGSGPFYLFGSGTGGLLIDYIVIGGIALLARRLLTRHHLEKLAQAARHHAERLEQAAKHHEESKAHLAQHLAAHCSDLKEHVNAVAAAGSQAAAERVPAPAKRARGM